ncbi:hypothetical protein [Cohnella mopanensis]|uniref:hypothetical protein n=1 Tax=Cohnella mopanensis TaxID=2911966 RepID=UPI001EF818A9|nr:hypothetical protein [Cohnella mopanensis]
MKRNTWIQGSLMSLLLLYLCACSNSNANDGNTSSNSLMKIVQETEHGLFYSPDPEEKVKTSVAALAEAFESNYDRITKLFEFEPVGKTVIHVYSDKVEFTKMIGRDTEGTYVAKENVIKVYTPAALEDPEVKADYVAQVVHEFVHAVTQQINPVVGYAKWLDEGLAYYASNQLETELETRSLFLDVPTLEQLEDPDYFAKAGGSAYFYSGSIIRFIVHEYGEKALNEIIKDPEQMEQILKESTQNIYEKWKADLLKT